MFGKGLYFADMFSKSAAYSQTGDGNYFLLLAEVVLGEMYLPKEPDCELKVPQEFLSVKGVGTEQPDFSQSVFLENGIEVPVGKIEASRERQRMLAHNEYIVYDTSQVRLRYFVHMKAELR
jgi:poly [ADP-ribose] polymerase